MSLWRRILVERRSVALPLGILLAANIAVLIAVVLPLRQIVAGATDARYTSSTELAAARQELADAERTTESRKQAIAGLQQFYDQVLSTGHSAAVTSASFWPEKTAKELGLVHTGIGTSQPIEIRDSRLMEVTSKFTLRGPYSGIRKFLYAVEAAEQFLVVDKIKLAQPSAQQSNSQTLEFELEITTFYLGGSQ
jgi:hypothetical protein